MPSATYPSVRGVFRSLISPLQDDERVGLEASILADGCRDALVVWKQEGVLLDGHNRLEICRRHKIDYRTKEISLPDEAAAKLWILKNQLGRRNLSATQRSLCAAAMATLERGANQHSSIEPSSSQAVAAELFNVSRESVKRARVVLEQGSAALVAATKADEIAVSAAAEIATPPKAEQERVVAVAKNGGSTTAVTKAIKRAKAKVRTEKRASQKAVAVAKKHPLGGEHYRLLAGDLIEAGAEIGDATVDAIITDPPYGIEHLEVYEKLAALASRVLVPGGHCLVMIGQANLPQVLRAVCSRDELAYQWTLAYLTPGQSTQVFGRKVKSNWKPVIWLVKGTNTWEHVEDSVTSDQNDKRFHEWGQSVGGMAQLVARFTVPKSTVLDPFVGGGATAIAALRLGRLFVGIDIDKAALGETAGRITGL